MVRCRVAVVLVAIVAALVAPGLARAQEPVASIVLGETNEGHGLSLRDEADGRSTPVTGAGMSGRATAPGDNPAFGRYLYFALDDDVAFDGFYVARVEVQYLDEGTNSFDLQYDSNDCTATLSGAYTPGGTVTKTNSGTWKTATFDLPNARFASRENGGSDFRLSAGPGDAGQLTVHSITVTIVEDHSPTPPTPAPGVSKPVNKVSLTRSADRLALDNGYVRAEFDLAHPQIDVVKADFDGRARYAADLTGEGKGPQGQSGIVLEADDRASSTGAGPDLRVRVLRQTAKEATVQIDGIVDDAENPLVTSTWTLSLRAEDRAFRLQTSTRALRSGDVRGVRIASYLSPSSVYGQFDRGAVQMMNSGAPYFASTSPLKRFYAIRAPGGGAVDVTASGQRETVLRSAASCGNAPGGAAYRTGLEQVLAGSYHNPDRWDNAGWAAAAPTAVTAGTTWRTDATIAANSSDFPDGALATPAPNLPADDLRAIQTAIYGTAAGVLDTYALPGEAAPTLASPGRTYGDGRNFYDPDTWMIVSALLYSGDAELQAQALSLIEKSGAAMLPSGQIPHHFEGANPTYVAISGATQTGPNIFWIAAALQYAKTTGDYGWLRAHMPALEKALGFLTDLYDPSVQLVKAPGPLWIDVFIREGFTSDTNAYMVDLLREMADAENLVGDADTAAHHRSLADDITEGMNQRLWADDHYVTQLNADGTTRDLVDYDSNLLAVAFGVAPADRAQAILARVDAGPCTHGRPTWVSEKTYGPSDTYGGNTGDSAVTMGRIAWADAHARRRVGDRATYEDKIIDPVRADLLARTWLTERYDCNGTAIRAPFYHEYPELVAMLLREVTYGIDLGLGTVTIDPFGPTAFHWHVGDVDVDYARNAVDLTLPGSGQRRFDIHGLAPRARYEISTRGATQRATADSDGVLRFAAAVGPDTHLRVRRMD
jgi:hypothetical protein